MASQGGEQVELKFRIFDGTDIAHSTYPLSTTVAALKQRIVAEWPQDKSIAPESVSDLRIIHSGKFLEDSTTLADCITHVGDLSVVVTTMHVVVQPAATKKKTDKRQERVPKQNSCSCTVL